MSKLIVEMEMPKFCIWRDDKNEPHRCPLLNEDDDCSLQDSNIWMGWNEQYAHCPIKGELPDEHGDLIDRDELRKMNVFSQEFNRYVVPMMYIEDANPIVAAERKDERRTR